jgi:tetratricopeptide (TPR) repeat protein
MFYYENNLELPTALKWLNAALAENPKAFWLIYRKGLIMSKMGDKKGAREAANQSLAMANEAKGSMKDEYVRLNEALIASLN